MFYCEDLKELILDSVGAVRTSLEETRQGSGRTLPHVLLDASVNCIKTHVFAIFRISGSDKMGFQIGKEQFNWIKVFPFGGRYRTCTPRERKAAIAVGL